MAKFYICRRCGNLVGMIHDSGVPMMCCGQKTEALEPNTVEELRDMLQEDCWSPGVKQIFRNEIARRLAAEK